MEKQRALLMRPKKNDLLAVGFRICGALPRSSTLPAANSQVGASPRTLLRWRELPYPKFVPALGYLLLIQIDIPLPPYEASLKGLPTLRTPFGIGWGLSFSSLTLPTSPFAQEYFFARVQVLIQESLEIHMQISEPLSWGEQSMPLSQCAAVLSPFGKNPVL